MSEAGASARERGGGADMNVTRRRAIAASLVGAAGIAAGLGRGNVEGKPEPDDQRRKAESPRMPVVYLPHGGGPWPFVDVGFGAKHELDALAAYLRSIRQLPTSEPKALLAISAHWEEAQPTVITSARPPMLYDYYGFPPESYRITWPAPGHPAIAERVRQLLAGAGLESGANDGRGFDHGTFVPLKLAYPEANVPTVQLSLKQGLDPAEHLAIGRALAPLRDEGVFIIGSGMTFHNLRAFGSADARPTSEAFDAWLRETATLEASERDRRLAGWADAPSARKAHPREEHLLPLMVVAGAAGADRGTVAYASTLMGVRISAYHFGA
jgi:aromatic ring-opening dioxygenase catalytic subunit (LigB family)